jgi:acyl-CoA reductase-like NAD-dependent aldehyde dehydrogenase
VAERRVPVTKTAPKASTGKAVAKAAAKAPAPKAVAKAEESSTAATASADDRIPVLKTYKLYIGGQFPRTESGRSYLVRSADGDALANACQGSRKDVRDAVRIARAASGGWAGRTAMNRGQILYRVAELMEGRFAQFVGEVAVAEGLDKRVAREVVGRSIDRWVWYAGWADKIAQILGSSNPVGAPYFNFTIPEPTGVVGIVAPEQSSLLGLVSRLGPVLAGGNVAVVLASETRPLPAITMSEVLATSDVPGGVVNIITGDRRELVPIIASHVDVDALDGWGIPDALRTAAEEAAADSVKRVSRRPRGVADASFDWLDDRAAERPEWISAFLEMKTVWHPIGV